MDMASFARVLGGSTRRVCTTALLCALVLAVAAVAGCESTTYSQRIRITAEAMNVDGLFAKVEYLRDGKVVNSVHLVDGDGDGVIDGKSGPKAGGTWPVGWQWFDDMYADTVVGETVIAFDEQKIVVKASKTYEFMTGEYEVRSSP
jgi:outer membrane murein-binding lipoprotein Lpp